MSIKLGINIDHAATLRNARAENDPSIVEFALAVQKGGADSITMHLREDRRHIRDNDIFLVREHCKIPVNFEMAATVEMLDIALKLNPMSACIVPEKRDEVTTEGGLDIKNKLAEIKPLILKLLEYKIDVFIFVEPDIETIKYAMESGATGVEVHTGAYAHSFGNTTARKKQLEKIFSAAQFCVENNFEFHAGHGLNYHNIYELLKISNLVEVNIGHSILSRALFSGIHRAVHDMKQILSGHDQ
ncbi:MAG: pyridoxine 5'-phosphate synthase [Spirochaetia bacterium]|nr:pyridoxine 5'-phosphate synthase [Spirochaetia bacterium]